ncbi:hypothetical protein [Nostoc sphaeroides]|nr:hypothetical protein [Nostoc sphaeroides]
MSPFIFSHWAFTNDHCTDAIHRVSCTDAIHRVSCTDAIHRVSDK